MHHLPRRPERAVDPVLDDRPDLLGLTRYNHLEPVGVRIYNRWLADFVSQAPARHFGIAHIPISDPEACVRGRVGGRERPERHQPAGARGDFPMYNDPVWEPLWAVCEETGLSLNTHGGGGEHYPYEGPGAQAMYMMETAWRTRRRLGDDPRRHLRPPPGLGLVLTEQWIDWAPQVMRDMDGLFDGPNGLAAASLGNRHRIHRQSCFFGASSRTGRPSSPSSTTSSTTPCGVTTTPPGGHLAAHPRPWPTRSATSSPST